MKASGRLASNDADLNTIIAGGYANAKLCYYGMLNTVWRRMLGRRFTGSL